MGPHGSAESGGHVRSNKGVRRVAHRDPVHRVPHRCGAALQADTSTHRRKCTESGDDGTRTHDPLLAKQVLFQLSYVPERGHIVRAARDQDPTGLPSRMPDVRLATAADIGPMAASLSKAFADDPVMAYLMGEALTYDKGVKFFSLMTQDPGAAESHLRHRQVRGGRRLGAAGQVEGAAARDREGDARLPQCVRGQTLRVRAEHAERPREGPSEGAALLPRVPRHRPRAPTQGTRRRGARAGARANATQRAWARTSSRRKT